MKARYTNDRSAPRMKKGQFSKMVVTKELYKRFKEEYPEYEKISWNEFYQSWLQIAERIRYYAIYNPLGVKLGSYTGELKFQYLPYDFYAIDYGKTQKEGEEMKHMNVAQKGKVPRIKWERRWAVKFNKMLQFYAFDETRDVTRLAYQYMLDNALKLRTARNTLGGQSVWRQKMKKYD